MLLSLINPAVISLSLCTAFGVFWHDTRLDKATTVGLHTPAIMASQEANTKNINLGGDAHTHTERHSFAQVVHDLKTQNPRIQPRSNDDRKHLMQKHAARGHHAFDNYNLPIV